MDAPSPSLEQYTELAEMAGGFIHDIKNHLGTLSLNLQLLAEDFEQPESQRERRALDRITRLSEECGKLVELSNDFLRFARAQELHREPVRLERVVERLVDFVSPTAKQAGIEIAWFSAPGLPPVSLDRELFEQALLNLLLNAEQAMPDGGTLSLICRAEGEHVCLDVIDTGCGMTAEQLQKVFRPFHTTKKNGTGLGLPTARKVILAHGGTIDMQSEPNRGTKVTIKLPAHSE
ncbi:MAG: ATP-binding protein [Gemmataceae bacterium]